jgi:hypothetical protein
MSSQLRRLLTVAFSFSLLTSTALSNYGVHAQTGSHTSPTVSNATFDALPLSNPLVLHNPQTGTSVQIMPTTAWLAQHTPPYGSSSMASTPNALPFPTCTLATDPSPNDAHVLVNNAVTQFDSLDISAFGLSSSNTTIAGQIAVQSLSDGSPIGTPAVPEVAGGGDIWYVVWTYGTTPGIKGYFLEAEYPGAPTDPGYTNNASTSNLPVDFTWGTIVTSPTGGEQFTSGGAASGSFDTTHNLITITAPLKAVGGARPGDTLASPYAAGDALLGTSVSGGLLENADTLPSSSTDYHVGNAGTNCPTPRQTVPSPGLPTPGSSSNLGYYGGPTVHTIKNYLIWWLPKVGTTTYSNGAPCTEPATLSYSYEQPASGIKPVGALPGGPDGDTDYIAIIEQYFKDLSGTAFYNLLTQYTDDERGIVINSEALGGTWTDHCGYTSTPTITTGPVPGGTAAAPIYQLDIQAEVQRAIAINHWPDGPGNEYFVYTGYGAADCFAPPGQAGLVPACNTAGPVPTYCAYHGDFQDAAGNYVLYANMADGAFAANPSTINLCYTAPIGVSDPTHTVNGRSITDPIADAEVSITSHEEFETVTDAEVGTAQQFAPPLAWYDPANGEIGDKCAYNYGNYAADGSNVVLHGDRYIVQMEWSNWNNGCGLTSFQGNASYGGASDAVTIRKGWTLIGVPVAGITSTTQLVANMERPGQLPTGSIVEIETYHNGYYQVWKPGAPPLPLHRTDGILILSKTAGTWTPTGLPYTSAPTITLNPGWNLVATTYPNPGLSTDSIYNQIAAETGACTASVLTNQPCSPTITQIKALDANGQYLVWTPAAPDANGNATWPQTRGNLIPFTSGIWIYAVRPLTWVVQGSESQTVDDAGVCH